MHPLQHLTQLALRDRTGLTAFSALPDAPVLPDRAPSRSGNLARAAVRRLAGTLRTRRSATARPAAAAVPGCRTAPADARGTRMAA